MIQQFKSGSKANSRQNICQCPTLHHCRVCQMQQVQQSNCKFCSHGLTNAATTKINHKQLQAWAIAKVANAIQAAQDKQTNKIMKMFTIMMQAMQGNKSTTSAPVGASWNQRSQCQKCPHCKLCQLKPEDCWELEANKAKHLNVWKTIAKCKEKET